MCVRCCRHSFRCRMRFKPLPWPRTRIGARKYKWCVLDHSEPHRGVMNTASFPRMRESSVFQQSSCAKGEMMQMSKRFTLVLAVAAIASMMIAGPAAAQQTKLKWAHVYETSEPYHKWSVWAAQEIEKRTTGRYHIDVFPASSLGKESDINQGLTLGTVDMIISGLSFAARTMPRIGVGYYPYTFRDGDHLVAWAKSPAFAEMTDEYRTKTGIQITAMTYYGVRHPASK